MSTLLPIATSIDRQPSAVFGLLSNLANRHGCITGATGTGKTVTLQVIAQQLSNIGVPVFMADVKGDLTGISQAGKIEGKLAAVIKERGLPAAHRVEHPLRRGVEDGLGELEQPFAQRAQVLAHLRVGRGLPEDDGPQHHGLVPPEPQPAGEAEQRAGGVARARHLPR